MAAHGHAAAAPSTSAGRRAEGPYSQQSRKPKRAAKEVIAALMADSQVQQFEEDNIVNNDPGETPQKEREGSS